MITIIVLIASQAHVQQDLLFNQLVFATGNTSITTTTRETEEESDPAATLSFPTNPTGNFYAAGSISSLIINNQTQNAQYVLAGNWRILALNGNTTEFNANFTMVSVDGKQRDIYSLTNFSSNLVAPLILDMHGTTFTGESDITTNGDVTWRAVQTTVTMAEHDVIRITIDEPNVSSHFHNQAIYGVVFSIREYEFPQRCY